MRFNFSSAIWASIIATIAMTIVMYFAKMNIMEVLGLAAGMKDPVMLYLVGGAIHLGVGIVYGVIYALIFEPLFKSLPGFIGGAIYSLLPFFIALFFMQPFLQSIGKVFGAESQNRSAMQSPQMSDENGKRQTPEMPVAKPKANAAKKSMPKAQKTALFWSFIVHLVYGAVLGFAYIPRIRRKKS